MILNEIITEIEKLDNEQLSKNYEKYEHVFNNFPKMVAAPIYFPLFFYRIRIANGTIDEMSPFSFSYKPESLNPEMNRLNLSGESVFYASIYPHTAIRELCIKY